MEIINQDNIVGIGLLSVDEAEAARDNIPPLDDWWWLRSPGGYSDRAACVRPGGNVERYGAGVRIARIGVRPALRIHSQSLDLQIGEKAQYGGRTFTHIAEDMLLCDEIICEMPFRRDRETDDANNYETSDVKKFLDKWLEDMKPTKKHVTHGSTIDIDAAEITLLSIGEVEAASRNISPLDDWWWLRSPGFGRYNVACVDPADSSVEVLGHIVNVYIGVRPAIRINPKFVDLQIGEKARLGDFTWTYISEGLFLCDSIISHRPFRKDWQTRDANAYEASDIKKYLDDWLSKALSKHGKNPELSQEEKLRIYYEQAHSLHMQDAKKRVIDYIKEKGYDPDDWLDKFDIDILAGMFEEKQGCNVTDNDTWLAVFRQYIVECRIPMENTYEVHFSEIGQSCVRVKAISKVDAEEKATNQIKDIINRMGNKDFGEFRNMDWRITDTRLIKS